MGNGDRTFGKIRNMDRILSTLPIIPIRKEPDHRSEQVSQLLFGETATIIQHQHGWLKIKTGYDSYSGWIEENAVKSFNNDDGKKMTILAEPLTLIWVEGHPAYLPAGSEIPTVPEDLNFTLGGYHFKLPEALSHNEASISETARKFLYAPYLWGGRTIFGIDCSGFTQIVFKIKGFMLPRDAKDQANTGKEIETMVNAVPEDLLFFGNDRNHICHVGIYLGGNLIIHASKSVRIDTVDKKGIFNNDLKEYTHQLQSIRRI
jgi:hypothetical protein